MDVFKIVWKSTSILDCIALDLTMAKRRPADGLPQSQVHIAFAAAPILGTVLSDKQELCRVNRYINVATRKLIHSIISSQRMHGTSHLMIVLPRTGTRYDPSCSVVFALRLVYDYIRSPNVQSTSVNIRPTAIGRGSCQKARENYRGGSRTFMGASRAPQTQYRGAEWLE